MANTPTDLFPIIEHLANIDSEPDPRDVYIERLTKNMGYWERRCGNTEVMLRQTGELLEEAKEILSRHVDSESDAEDLDDDRIAFLAKQPSEDCPKCGALPNYSCYELRTEYEAGQAIQVSIAVDNHKQRTTCHVPTEAANTKEKE